jgi:hypothetical protein
MTHGKDERCVQVVQPGEHYTLAKDRAEESHETDQDTDGHGRKWHAILLPS